MNYLEKPLKFMDEYRFFRRKGFKVLNAVKRARFNVKESKRIIREQGGYFDPPS